MSEARGAPLFALPVHSIDEAGRLIGRLFDVARTDAVYGEPLTRGDATVIVASELAVGMGVGFGAGEEGEHDGENSSDSGGSSSGGSSSGGSSSGGSSSGGGGGGGGYALARPVAVVTIDAQGVRVTPVFDLTKVAIAGITALGAMFIAYRRMVRASNDV